MVQHKRIVLSTEARFAEGVDARFLFNISEVDCVLHESYLSEELMEQGTLAEIQSSRALSRNVRFARLLAISLNTLNTELLFSKSSSSFFRRLSLMEQALLFRIIL